MAAITRFEDIHAWQTARQITQLVYGWSNEGNFARDFGLRDQMRRATVSVMSNIAEGFESHTQQLFISYLGRAKASCAELRAQAYVAFDVGYIDQTQFDTLYRETDKCSRQLYSFIAYLRSLPADQHLREQPTDYQP